MASARAESRHRDLLSGRCPVGAHGAPRPCRLFGAYRVAIGAKDAVVLVHSSLGCEWGTLALHAPSRGNDVRQASTVLDEAALASGGEGALRRALGEAVGLYGSRPIFVLTGCAAEIMGDDVGGVVRRHFPGAPVMVVESAGFAGDEESGRMAALAALAGAMPPAAATRPRSVNVVGLLSDDFKAEADRRVIARLLGEEVEVVSFLPFGPMRRLRRVPEAALNLCLPGFERAGVMLRERFGTPFVMVDYPYGLCGSERFVRSACAALGLDPGRRLSDAAARALDRLERAADGVAALQGMPALVLGDRARKRAMRAFLRDELGAVPVEDPEELPPALVLGSSFDRGLADRLDVPLIRYSYPVFDVVAISSRPYAGFSGAVGLVEDILNALASWPYRRSGMFGADRDPIGPAAP